MRARIQWLVVLLAVFVVPVRGQDFIMEAISRSSKQPIQRLSSVEITLERTGCFGFCIPYRVEICGHDRSVRYFGAAFDTGDRSMLRTSLEVSELYGLLEKFYRVRFFELPDAYTTTPKVMHTNGPTFVVTSFHTTDLSDTILGLRVEDRSKRVTLRVAVPEDLQALAASIDELIGTPAFFRARYEAEHPAAVK